MCDIQKPCGTFQEVGHVLQLWDIVLPVAAVLDEQREHVVVLFAGVCGVQLRKLPKDSAPGGNLLRRVVNVWQRLPVLVVVRNVREVLAPSSVLWVGEARVVGVQLRAVRQDLVGESVQITNTPREPWYRVC